MGVEYCPTKKLSVKTKTQKIAMAARRAIDSARSRKRALRRKGMSFGRRSSDIGERERGCLMPGLFPSTELIRTSRLLPDKGGEGAVRTVTLPASPYALAWRCNISSATHTP